MCSSQGDSARLELLSRVTVIRSLLVDQLNEVWGSEDLLIGVFSNKLESWY